MAYRQFHDAAGVEWTVYDVVPRADERRSTDRRGEVQPDSETPEERRAEDRRATVTTPRPTRLTSGWLCFENGAVERRRLKPIPEKWHLLPDAGLIELLAKALEAPRRTVSGQGPGRARP
jgi:hypothetical protein